MTFDAENDGEQPVHGLVGGLRQERVAGLHLPAAGVLLATAISLKSLSRVGLSHSDQF